MRKQLIIWGSGGHALVVADVVRLTQEYDIVGIIDDLSTDRHGTTVAGAVVLGGREQLESLKRGGVTHVIVAVGDCTARVRLGEFALERGFDLGTAIHPRAIVASDAVIGAGTVVAAGAIVNPGVTIGRSCIINVGASVDHECRIGDGAHIGPGVYLGGQTTVGQRTWLGIGATVIDRIQIGEGSIVGAGSVIIRDIPNGVVVYGSPGRVARKVDKSE
jgi:UDP-N-acetylbacillosamine N-acetyltransferase